LGECAGRPLDDNRVLVHLGDVAELFKTKQATYDVVLLDVDNGPEGFTQADNNKLYSIESLQAIRQTLHPGGVLAIWSAWHDPKFTLQLKGRIKVKVVVILSIWPEKNRKLGIYGVRVKTHDSPLLAKADRSSSNSI
jgi:spermidine synthase